MPWAAPVTRATPFAIVILLGKGDNKLETVGMRRGLNRERQLSLSYQCAYLYIVKVGSVGSVGSYYDGAMGISRVGWISRLKARRWPEWCKSNREKVLRASHWLRVRQQGRPSHTYGP
jgi:hypothetical protein